MEIKILEERANPLLHRREYRLEITHATVATPKREEVRAEMAKLVKAPKDRVIVERMHPRFGTAVTRGDVHVYETTEAVKKIVREHILVRQGLLERPAKAPAAAEPPKAEAPTPPAEKKE